MQLCSFRCSTTCGWQQERAMPTFSMHQRSSSAWQMEVALSTQYGPDLLLRLKLRRAMRSLRSNSAYLSICIQGLSYAADQNNTTDIHIHPLFTTLGVIAVEEEYIFHPCMFLYLLPSGRSQGRCYPFMTSVVVCMLQRWRTDELIDDALSK